MRSRRLPGLVLLAIGASFYACNVYDSSLKEQSSNEGGVPVPSSEWGSGVGWWSSKSPDGCISAGVPTAADRPKVNGGTSIDPILLGVRSMALGSLDRQGSGKDDGVTDTWKDLGFDLDNMCTNSETCPRDNIVAPCTSQGSSIPYDGRYCRDNTFGRLENEAVSLPSIGQNYGLSNDGFNCALCRGDYNFLVKISDWNGKPDDDQIRVDLYPSPGLEKAPAWTCQKSDPTHAWRKNTCWGPKDAWTVTPDAFDGTIGADNQLPPAKLDDPAAYVKDGYIVAQLPANALFWFPGDNGVTRAYPLKMQGGIVTGKLEQDSSGAWRISDGTIAGRAKKDDLISGFQELGLCESNAGTDWSTMLLFVNNYADILSTGAISPDAQCDALSVGIGFDADQAAFNGTVRAVAPLPGCPDADAGTDGAAGAAGDAGTDASDGGGGTDASLDGAGGTGGASGASAEAAACSQFDEPNDTEATAASSTNAQCGGTARTVSAALDVGDTDWYLFNATRYGSTCSATLTAGVDAGLDVCVYAACKAPVVSCSTGASATSPDGNAGCCASGNVAFTVTCGGTVPTSLEMHAEVKSSSGAKACTPYTLTYSY